MENEADEIKAKQASKRVRTLTQEPIHKIFTKKKMRIGNFENSAFLKFIFEKIFLFHPHEN